MSEISPIDTFVHMKIIQDHKISFYSYKIDTHVYKLGVKVTVMTVFDSCSRGYSLTKPIQEKHHIKPTGP